MLNEKIIPASYGSIPHLSTSKLTQQADKKISPGQEKILLEKVRDKHDIIIVTEKVDGSNVGVIRKDGDLIPITRKGYRCVDSPYKQHRMFHRYVMNRLDKFDFLEEGWRVCGEWCAMAHGTLYDLNPHENSPFVVFDIIDDRNKRLPHIRMYYITASNRLSRVPVLLYSVGKSIPLNEALLKLDVGWYGAPWVYNEKPEGVVYRCERKGKFDFAAKWVRGDKVDGKYMKDDIWHITEDDL